MTDRVGKPWSYEYDLRGNLTKETSPLGDATRRCYDANDNEVVTVRPNSTSTTPCALDGTDGHSTKRTYDARDSFRMRQGAPGVTCSPAMNPSLIQRCRRAPPPASRPPSSE